MPNQDDSKLRRKRSYTLRDLPIKSKHKVQDYILELGGKADEIQALKRPGEMWYFSLFGNRSRLYEDINLLQPDLAAWAMSAQQEAHGKNSNDAVVHGIKLLKFRGKGVSANTELEDEDFETVQEQFSNIRRKARANKCAKEKKETFERAKAMLEPKRTKNSPTPTTGSILKKAASIVTSRPIEATPENAEAVRQVISSSNATPKEIEGKRNRRLRKPMPRLSQVVSQRPRVRIRHLENQERNLQLLHAIARETQKDLWRLKDRVSARLHRVRKESNLWDGMTT